MFYRVARYNIPTYNGYCKIEVPLGAEPVGILSDTVTTTGKTPIFVCVNEPIEKNPKDVETQELEFLVVGDGSPYEGDRSEDESLLYLGYASWDNGYRIHHVFQVLPGFDLQLDYTVEPTFDAEEFIEVLENPEGVEEEDPVLKATEE